MWMRECQLIIHSERASRASCSFRKGVLNGDSIRHEPLELGCGFTELRITRRKSSEPRNQRGECEDGTNSGHFRSYRDCDPDFHRCSCNLKLEEFLTRAIAADSSAEHSAPDVRGLC